VFDDARQVPDNKHFYADICIIGGGAAGTTIATEFIGSRYKVLVVESGGLAYESQTQALYKGINSGLLYEPLDLCRVRTFGGSTDPRGWGGWCKPLSGIDFERRDWVPLSGWPIAKKELTAHYRRAFATLSLPEDTERLADDDAGAGDVLPVSGQYCRNEPCPLSPEPHLGQVTEARLRGASNVSVLLHANVTEVVTDPSAKHVTGLKVATLDGKTHLVTASHVILAAGGVENARILLLSDQVQREGLGNGSGFVGRCFMEHPRYSWGRLSGKDIAPLLLRYNPATAVGARQSTQPGVRSGPIFGASLALTERVQRERRLLGSRTWILPVSGSGDRDAGREFKELIFWLKKRRVPSDLSRRIIEVLRNPANAASAAAAHVLAKLRPPTHWQFVTVLEQEPNPASRVTLDASRDALGLRRVRLDWRIGELTKTTLVQAREIFTEELRAAGFDCAIEASPKRPSNQDADAPRWVWHHMGTTRMAADANDGVVDANCCVHGMTNLYIAGSSVFPTVGNDMPTLTVVALAHRLADHLKLKLTKAVAPDVELGRVANTRSDPASTIAIGR
jgi:choline dehydrogenase-like flavoprotein